MLLCEHYFFASQHCVAKIVLSSMIRRERAREEEMYTNGRVGGSQLGGNHLSLLLALLTRVIFNKEAWLSRDTVADFLAGLGAMR